LGILILIFALIRIRLSGIALERDEGEYAYFGAEILKGTVPFKVAFSLKLPGTSVMYALIILFFGKTAAGIHSGLLLFNSATILFLYLGFRKIFNSPIALFTAGVYGIMSISYTVLGFAAHATHFISFFVSLGIFFTAKFYKTSKPVHVFLAGIMFGMSFLMKQQAIFFILFGIAALLLPFLNLKTINKKSIASVTLIYGSGALLPYGLTLLILLLSGAFDNFWFWTVEYAGKYVSEVPLKNALGNFVLSFMPMWAEFSFFWIFFVLGLIALFLTKWSIQQKLFALLFAVFSFLSICPGLFFRDQYFISFLPAVGLLGAICLEYVNSLLKRLIKTEMISFLPVLVFLLISLSAVSGDRPYYLEESPDQISRAIYETNPFPESIQVAKYIKKNSSPSDKIAILGSEPQILFYADRKSATSYLYCYPLLEKQEHNIEMQQKMISEIENCKPKFLVLCDIDLSWLPRPDSPMNIFGWFERYANNNYVLTGAVIIDSSQTYYFWDRDVQLIKSADIKKFSGFRDQKILVYKLK
jgi:hypothetical protein